MSWNDLRKGRYSQASAEYFITFNTHNRLSIFEDVKMARLFCQHIAVNEQKQQCKWLTWVLMPDHFHGLLRLGEKEQLSKVIAELKGTTAYKINAELDRKENYGKHRFMIMLYVKKRIERISHGI